MHLAEANNPDTTYICPANFNHYVPDTHTKTQKQDSKLCITIKDYASNFKQIRVKDKVTTEEKDKKQNKRRPENILIQLSHTSYQMIAG